ncbi:MAG: 30S ribosomal protein S13, partial [Candidatus Micrarchaeia archaeon]
DVENKKKMWSWQGERLIKGKKARGQRTRNTGRRGLAVGVMKKKEMPGQAPPGAPGAKAPASAVATKPQTPAKPEAPAKK